MKWQLLHNACWAGDLVEVERLLQAGADPNQIAPTNWRQTPLGRTLEFRITAPKHAGHARVVEILLRYGADPRIRSTSLDLTPYELACVCGLESAAELLRPFQAQAQAHPSGMTGLWMAAASRLPESVALAEVQAAGHSEVNSLWRNASPLMMATAHAAHFQVADCLLTAGADATAGVSLLHAACNWHFQHLHPALHYLAARGWPVNAQDASGQTALHKAAFLGYASTIRLLLQLGADASARDLAGCTPCDVARQWRKPAAVKALGCTSSTLRGAGPAATPSHGGR